MHADNSHSPSPGSAPTPTGSQPGKDTPPTPPVAAVGSRPRPAEGDRASEGDRRSTGPAHTSSRLDAPRHDPDVPEQFEIEGLSYTLDQPPKPQGKRTVVTVKLAEHAADPGFRDRADFFSFRSRKALAGRIADAFGRRVPEILGHLAVILDSIERTQAEEPRPSQETLTPDRRRAAEALLEDPNLLDRAAQAMTSLGYVGEEENKRLAFLVAVSRLLKQPLSAIFFASSGAGKSDLLEKLSQLLPEESMEFLSRVSAQALFYAGRDHLRHKVVIVDEQVGAASADYAIRTLQTKGLLRLAVPISGKIQHFEAYGPIALLSGTTRNTLNAENLSRCLELSLDDSREQTARVHAAQRRAWEGRRKRPVNTQLWQDAQRLLEPLSVVIPFASKLSYPAKTTKSRRDNQKLLSLIASHCLLFQRQRERDQSGRVVAELMDYGVVHGLLKPLVDSELDGLSRRAADLYRSLAKIGREVTRREVSKLLGWSYMTATRALKDLVQHELVLRLPKQRPRRYRVVDRSLLDLASGLTAPGELGS